MGKYELPEKVNKTARIRYANRTPEQIITLREYLRKFSRSKK